MNTRWTLPAVAAGAATIASIFLGGCAAAADPITPLSTSSFVLNFEDHPLDLLGAPWRVSRAGASEARVVNATGHGRALLLSGSRTEGHFLIATTPIPMTSGDLTVQLEVRPIGTASGIFTLFGNGPGYSRRQLRLMREPGSPDLVAAKPAGNVRCGPLPADVWSTVTLSVHAAQPRTFDVLIDGAPTACTGLPTRLTTPFQAVGVMDASNAGWGGDMDFDNIAVF